MPRNGGGSARFERRDAPRSALCSAILLAMLLAAPRAGAQTMLHPVGRDGSTDLHFLAGVSAGLVTAALVENLLPAASRAYPFFAPAAALYTATVAGIGKELLDSTGFGTADFPDILFAAAGGVVAGALVSIGDGLFPSTSAPNRGALYLSTALLLSAPVAVGAIGELGRALARRGSENP